MKKLITLLAAITLTISVKAQNVIYLVGMNANGQPVVNTIPIPQVVNDGLYSSLLSKPANMTLTTTGITGAASYNSASNILNIPNYASPVTYTAGTGLSLTGTTFANTAPDQTVSFTVGNANETITGTYPNFTITPYIPTINANVTRPINSTTFTISTTRPATVYYSVNISCTATIGSNSTGKVSLQYSTNAGSTWTDVSDVSNSNTVSLAIVLNSVTAQDAIIAGQIPANALVRMVTATTGTASCTFVRGMEIY